MKKVLYMLYYLVVDKLPNSRYLSLTRKFRVFYTKNILGVSKGGSNAYFEENVYIGSPGKVLIGIDCQINENVFIQSAEIGDHVMIAPGVAIISTSHDYQRVDIPMALQGKLQERKVIVENDVWIGRNAIIMPGLKIGRGSIIGAGAVVTKNVEPFSVVGGVPAKTIRTRR
ncbi:MAG: acyltransferase [Flavobacteriales bacterium]|nr:acyltransferase [Flavobacteriales bacterium]